MKPPLARLCTTPDSPGSFAEEVLRRTTPVDFLRRHQGERPPVEAVLFCSLGMLHCVIERAGNRIAGHHGLTMPQWLALGCIGHQGDEGIQTSELGQRLMLSKGPITGLVDRLERAGHVQRANDPQDRRVTRVFITPSGLSVWDETRLALRSMGESFWAGLTEDQRQQLSILLGQALEHAVHCDPLLSATRHKEEAP